MAPQHAAALGADAACVGAALAAKVAVLGLAQILSVALEDDEPEDQTEAEWGIDRLNKLRLRSRQLRQTEMAQQEAGVRATFTLYSVPVDISHDVRRMEKKGMEIYHRRA